MLALAGLALLRYMGMKRVPLIVYVIGVDFLFESLAQRYQEVLHHAFLGW